MSYRSRIELDDRIMDYVKQGYTAVCKQIHQSLFIYAPYFVIKNALSIIQRHDQAT